MIQGGRLGSHGPGMVLWECREHRSQANTLGTRGNGRQPDPRTAPVVGHKDTVPTGGFGLLREFKQIFFIPIKGKPVFHPLRSLFFNEPTVESIMLYARFKSNG